MGGDPGLKGRKQAEEIWKGRAAFSLHFLLNNMEIVLVAWMLSLGLRRAEVSEAIHQKDTKLGLVGPSWKSEQFPPCHSSRKEEPRPS